MRRLRSPLRPAFFVWVASAALLAGGSLPILGTCGPFGDVAADGFCPFVEEIFYLGITTGTTPTTYDPSGNVTRLQMAAFLSRTVDGVLKKGSRRAALGQFWTPQGPPSVGLTTVGNEPLGIACDGVDLWVASYLDGAVSRVRASDGRLLETWTGAVGGKAVLAAAGSVFVTGYSLYRIDPSQPAGAVTTVASNLGLSRGIAFDGSRLWIVGEWVGIVTPSPTLPWSVTAAPFGSKGPGALYDGSNIWVTDQLANKLFKLDPDGAVLQTVTVGYQPYQPVFDGANIWVPNIESDSVSVVRASSGAILATLTGNGLALPAQASFDGERILITNVAIGNSVSLWKAADLTPIGSFSVSPSSAPAGACSDGVNFWITLPGSNQLVRF